MSRRIGQIVPRGDGRWLVRVFLGRDCATRKRIYYNRTIRGSLRQAQAHLTKKLHERDLRRGVEAVQVTLDEFLDHWLKTAAKPRIREKTYRDYEAMLHRYIRPHIGAKKLAILSPLDIQNSYQRMLEDGLSSRTVRYVHSVLRCALNQAVRWQQLMLAPTSGVVLPRERSREMCVLSTQQARSFLRAAITSEHGIVFAIALTTGMRPSEYLALRWQDFDWEHGTVSVVRSLHRYRKQWVFEDTKRARSRRLIKLQNWLLAMLLKHREEVQANLAESGRISVISDLVFTTNQGEPINENYLVKRFFKPILREAGLPDIRLYDLRHTAATVALTLGISPKVVSELLGHASAAFTLDTYSHVLPHMREEAAAKMESALVGNLSLADGKPAI
jgi:integrase